MQVLILCTLQRETRLARSEQSFKTEMDGQKRLVQLLERKLQDEHEYRTDLQKTLSEAQEDWDSEKAQLEDKLNGAEATTAGWKEQVDTLYEENDRLRYQLEHSTHDASFSNGSFSPGPDASNSRVSLRDMTFTTAYANWKAEEQRRMELERELEIQKDRLADAHERLEQMNPHLHELEQENERLTSGKAKLFEDYSKALEEQNAVNARMSALQISHSEATNEINVLHQGNSFSHFSSLLK